MRPARCLRTWRRARSRVASVPVGEGTGSGDFGQRGLDVIGGGELGASEGGGDQRVVGEQIDFARETGGGVEERFFGGRIEERDLGAGQFLTGRIREDRSEGLRIYVRANSVR